MSDPAFQALLAVLQRELGAVDAYLQLGGKEDQGPERVVHVLDETSRVVAVFARAPSNASDVRSRMAALCATFQETIEGAAPDAVRLRVSSDDTRQRLDDALTGLVVRAGAARSFVFDLDSPVIWGASVLAGNDADGDERLRRAVQQLRSRAEELRHAHGHTLRLELDDGVEALVRPFAGLYVLALSFSSPISEPVALGAIVHAVGLIERLVLALPPIDPGPGAKVIRLRPLSGPNDR